MTDHFREFLARWAEDLLRIALIAAIALLILNVVVRL